MSDSIPAKAVNAELLADGLVKEEVCPEVSDEQLNAALADAELDIDVKRDSARATAGKWLGPKSPGMIMAASHTFLRKLENLMTHACDVVEAPPENEHGDSNEKLELKLKYGELAVKVALAAQAQGLLQLKASEVFAHHGHKKDAQNLGPHGNLPPIMFNVNVSPNAAGEKNVTPQQ